MIQTSQHYWFGMFFVVEKTESVIEVLKENNIHNKNIPNNMSNYYQPLDLTTNNWAKEFLKTKFSQWYSEQIQDAKEMFLFRPFEEIYSHFKPLIETFSYFFR